MEEKIQGQQAAMRDLEEAFRWFHDNYGSDLPAFFRDAFDYQKTGALGAHAISKPAGTDTKPSAVKAAGS